MIQFISDDPSCSTEYSKVGSRSVTKTCLACHSVCRGDDNFCTTCGHSLPSKPTPLDGFVHWGIDEDGFDRFGDIFEYRHCVSTGNRKFVTAWHKLALPQPECVVTR